MSIHDLTTNEKELSKMASDRLGFQVSLFFDGDWICSPKHPDNAMGWGETYEEAIDDCAKANERGVGV